MHDLCTSVIIFLSAAVLVNITGSGVQVAGKNYTLNCTVSGGAIGVTTSAYTWHWNNNQTGEHQELSPSLLSVKMVTMDPTPVRQQGMAGLSGVRVSPYLFKVSIAYSCQLFQFEIRDRKPHPLNHAHSCTVTFQVSEGS